VLELQGFVDNGYQVLDLCAGEAKGLRTFASNETHQKFSITQALLL
jgi:hypothetical protein